MKKLFIFLAFMIPRVLHSQDIIYVKSDGTGDGSSWENACNLDCVCGYDSDDEGCLKPAAGTQIWVQGGTYYPKLMLVVPAGVALLGGFSGTETQLTERNFAENPTIIDAQKKFGSVVRLDTFAVIDGFTIQNGNAAGFLHHNGGGIWADYGASIKRCTLRNNAAFKQGGGIYAKDVATLYRCSFENNVANHEISNYCGNCVIYDTVPGDTYSKDEVDSLLKEVGVLLTVPDYARQESTNRITANNGTWTADRAGFVECFLWHSPSGYAIRYFYVNNKTVFALDQIQGIGRGCLMQVNKGDVVKMSTSKTVGGIACYFIPPKQVLAIAGDQYAIPLVDRDYYYKEEIDAILSNISNKIAVPDYSNTESTSRITGNNGTWTTDKAGWVRAYITHSSSPSGYATRYFYVDNRLSFALDQLKGVRVGCMLPLSKGNTVKVSTNGTFQEVACYYIPPKSIAITAEAPATIETPKRYYTKNEIDFLLANVNQNTNNTMFVPDYINMEGTNRITVNNGTWTADRDGFVWCFLEHKGSKTATRYFMINHQPVFILDQAAGIGQGCTMQVSKGDVVQLSSYGSIGMIGCYFIPGKLVPIELKTN